MVAVDILHMVVVGMAQAVENKDRVVVDNMAAVGNLPEEGVDL